jgi:short-subunit dehydrogenase
MTDNAPVPGTAVITGASRGIGAVYADRLARRGHDLLLVARDKARLDALAARNAERTGRSVEVLAADLTDPTQLALVEDRLRTDKSIDVLVNNAGVAHFTNIAGADPAMLERLVALNVTAPTRLTTAVLDGMSRRGRGTIVNVASILGIHLLPTSAVYSATKSYVLSFTRALQQELAGSNIRVQAVLPGAVRTEIWSGSGVELSALPDEWIMSVDDAVDAALSGLDAGEAITIPSLPDMADWERFEQARLALIPNLSRSVPADRYRRLTA